MCYNIMIHYYIYNILNNRLEGLSKIGDNLLTYQI